MSDPCGLSVYSNYLHFSGDPTIDCVDLDCYNAIAGTEQIVSDDNGCGVFTDSVYAGALTIRSYRSSHGVVTIKIAVSNPASVPATPAEGRLRLLKHRGTSPSRAGKVELTLHLTPVATGLDILHCHP